MASLTTYILPCRPEDVTMTCPGDFFVCSFPALLEAVALFLPLRLGWDEALGYEPRGSLGSSGNHACFSSLCGLLAGLASWRLLLLREKGGAGYTASCRRNVRHGQSVSGCFCVTLVGDGRVGVRGLGVPACLLATYLAGIYLFAFLVVSWGSGSGSGVVYARFRVYVLY